MEQTLYSKARHPEQVRTDQLSDDQLRSELAAAIDAHELALCQVAEANHIVERAREAITRTEMRLTRFADLDSRIAAFNQDRLRSGQLTGLPADLIEQRREQREIQELLNATQRAFIALGTEAQTAKLNVETMAQTRDAAAVAIISRHCDHIAIEIEQTQQRLHDLRQLVDLWFVDSLGRCQHGSVAGQ